MSAELPILTSALVGETPGQFNPVTCRYLRFGPFQIDTLRQQLSKNGVRVKLYGKAYQVLLLLLECQGTIVTRERIRQRLWHAESDVNVDANINTTVNRIRLVLKDGPGSPGYIDTIPRKGYSFIGQVEMTNVPRFCEEAAHDLESGEQAGGTEGMHSGRFSSAQWNGKVGRSALVVLAITLSFLAGFHWTKITQAPELVLMAMAVLAVGLGIYHLGRMAVLRVWRSPNS